MKTLDELKQNATKLDEDQRSKLIRMAMPRVVEQYIKHIPHPTQQFFLTLNEEEALYGGAAGGGKSDALLMSALQYADVPGYSALLLRRTWPDLMLPGAIMDRTRQWLEDTDAQPKDGGRIWVFPSGAKLTFGYLQYDKDKYRYQSAEFQFIGFDELTQFQQETYEYMFSRIRRPSVSCLTCKTSVKKVGNQYKHSKADVKCSRMYPDPKVLAQYSAAKDGTTLFDVPLRMRAATNPGGIGHTWVREHFINPKTRRKGSIFVPASLTDNPSLDQDSYVKNLSHLGVLDRERLLNGDWDVTAEGTLFQRHWFTIMPEPPVEAKYIRYWDMAATTDGDWTVGAKVGLTPDGKWVIADIKRVRLTPQNVERLVRQTAMEDGIETKVMMEQEGGSSGLATVDHYRRNILLGFDFSGDRPSGSKTTRAMPVSSAAEAGNVYLVSAPWNKDFLDEISLFPNGAHDDQVDAVSGAFHNIAFGRRARIIV